MSVDTYLRGKNTGRYLTMIEDDLKLLIAQPLVRDARSLTIDVTDFLFWRSLRAQAEPKADHFHSPACRH